MPAGAGAGGAALLGTVGPNRDLESEDGADVDEGPGAIELGFALDEAGPDEAAPAVTTSDGLRRNIHANAIRSTIASERINPIRPLRLPGFSAAFSRTLLLFMFCVAIPYVYVAQCLMICGGVNLPTRITCGHYNCELKLRSMP